MLTQTQAQSILQQVQKELNQIKLTAGIDIESDLECSPSDIGEFSVAFTGWPADTHLCSASDKSVIWTEVNLNQLGWEKQISILFPGYKDHFEHYKLHSLTLLDALPQCLSIKGQILVLLNKYLHDYPQKFSVELLWPVTDQIRSLLEHCRQNRRREAIHDRLTKWGLQLVAKNQHGSVKLTSGYDKLGEMLPSHSVGRILDSINAQ